jgi:putative NADPH-quinone reductase
LTVLVILAHPNPASFNHALAAAAAQALAGLGHEVVFHDLYAEGFDPLLTAAEMSRRAELPPALAAHCAELARAEGLVFVHPNWWGMPPAVLTGWLDRVLRPGLAYEFLEGDAGEGVPRGLLQARAAVVFNTGDTEAGRERRVFGDPLERIWRDCVCGLCGVRSFTRRLFGVVVTSTPQQRQAWLEEAARTVAEVFGPA